jgi:formylglycine-generating enzyme required for sulfatase activity
VNWYEAMAYAAWVGGSLPTEAQWEYAAGGPGESPRVYPWGDRPKDGKICGHLVNCVNGSLVDVESNPKGATPPPAVIYDLMGNPWEWCRDWYAEYPDREEQDPVGPPTGTVRVLRGGSVDYDPEDLRGDDRGFEFPQFGDVLYGFRVVFGAAGGRK